MQLTKTNVSLSCESDKGRYVQATRSDGLEIFFDKSEDTLSCWLNRVRAEGSRQSVFLAVGMARGLQIALNYATKYGSESECADVLRQIDALACQRFITTVEET